MIISGRAALIATGSTYRRTGAEGEEDLIGAGIHFCATCDGPFYKGAHMKLGKTALLQKDGVQVAVGTGVLFGLYPALHGTRPDLAVALRRPPGPRLVYVVGQGCTA